MGSAGRGEKDSGRALIKMVASISIFPIALLKEIPNASLATDN